MLTKHTLKSHRKFYTIRLMKTTFTIAAVSALCLLGQTGAMATGMAAPASEDPEIIVPDSTGFTFTDVKTVRTTPVKDQNKSGTCWSFSGTSIIEDEVMRKGGPELDISEMYTVRQAYIDKAKKYIRTGGKTNFAQGGSFADVLYVMENYGAMPEEAYTGLNYGEKKHSHYELAEAMEAYLKAIDSNPGKRLSTAWLDGLTGILDAYLGKVPEKFEYNGKSYTPQSFAKEMGIVPSDFVSLTSFTHHPFYRPFALEIADNWLWAESMNIPLEELKSVVDNAIENGYSVGWAADVSEGGFQWRKGFALLPEEKGEGDMEGTELSRWVQLSDKDRDKERFNIKGPVKEISVTQESRQEGFDRRDTTDDHGMTIIGIATDQEGNRYYKVKNSWDTNQLYGGYIYVSEPFFLDKTISITVNKEAVPKSISKKFNK